MIVSLIVAMDERGGIGYHGALPWRLSADLKRFKELTLGHHLIVGRKTFESIGRPLPGRQMIVITRNPGYQAEGVTITHSIEAALRMARNRGETEAFVGGGAEVYSETVDLADRIYLTQVHAKVDSDAYFPELDMGCWRLEHSSEHEADTKNQYPVTFTTLARNHIVDRDGKETNHEHHKDMS